MVSSTALDIDGLEREQLFDVARQYPLLTAEEERTLDGRKWRAAAAMEKSMLQDSASHAYLATLLKGCRDFPPDVASLRPREHYYLLRREMSDLLGPGGRADGVLADLQSGGLRSVGLRSGGPHSGGPQPGGPHSGGPHSGGPQTETADGESPLAPDLPPSLCAGVAASVLRHGGRVISCNVADALEAWERQWPEAEAPAGIKLKLATERTLLRERRAYLQARDTLVLHNLRLVYTIAGRNKGKGVGFTDLVQEGIFGLIRAAEKYDHRKGFRFSTYSFNWITQAVRRAVGNHGGLIRYPTHIQEKVGKLYRERLEFQDRTGAEPGDSELAAASGISLAETRELLKLRNQAYSLDTSPGEDTGSLYETLPAAPADDVSRPAEIQSLQRLILDELGESLEPVEQDVIIARWGLEHGRPLSRAEMADRLRVSTERVRQLENSALNKLQHNPELRSTFETYQPGPAD